MKVVNYLVAVAVENKVLKVLGLFKQVLAIEDIQHLVVVDIILVDMMKDATVVLVVVAMLVIKHICCI